MSVTYEFKDLDQIANYMDELAQDKRREARETKKLKDRGNLFAVASVYSAISDMLRNTRLTGQQAADGSEQPRPRSDADTGAS